MRPASALAVALACVPLMVPAAAAGGGPAPSARYLPGAVEARVTRVLDGDTFEARIRIWFGQDVTVLVRIAGVDAPELAARCSTERLHAEAASAGLAELLDGGRIILRDMHLDKYCGRIVSRVLVEDAGGAFPQTDVAAVMRASGQARGYAGKRRSGWCGLDHAGVGLRP